MNLPKNLALVILLQSILLVTPCARGQSNFTLIHGFSALPNVAGRNSLAPLAAGPDGTLYGTLESGGGNVAGEVFKISSTGTGFTVLKYFTNAANGANPAAGLVLSGITLYGTTQYGGSSGNGLVFAVKTNGTGFTNLYSFSTVSAGTNGDGAVPVAGLLLSGGTLYGTTQFGGSNGNGSVFAINTNGSGFANLYSFSPLVSRTNSDGANPVASLILSGGTLYGTAEVGGAGAYGTVFSINTNGTGFTNLINFAITNGANPGANLVLSGSTLYGTTEDGGSSHVGSVFKINTNGTGFATLYSFNAPQALYPQAPVSFSSGTLYGTTFNGNEGGEVFTLNTNGTGYTFTQFTGNNGAGPSAGLVPYGSYLYGTTSGYNGESGNGTIFYIFPSIINISTLYTFPTPSPATETNGDGANPAGGLVPFNGTLYGTSYGGGSNGYGVVYSVNTNGANFSNVFSFNSMNGANPAGSLVMAGGTLYGITQHGGSNSEGTIYSVNVNGTGFTNLYNSGSDLLAGLVLGGGTLFGTTKFGGSNGEGSVFAIGTNGAGFTNLYSLGLSTVYLPNADMVLSGGVLFGTTEAGGAYLYGAIFAAETNGSGLTVVHSFDFNDGSFPVAGLVSNNGTLYGTTKFGGTNGYGYGTVFAVNTDGTGFASLHSFDHSDGANPEADLVFYGGVLYGTTTSGGNGSGGTVFQINPDGTGFATIYNFSFSDGAFPAGALAISGGILYGTTEYGGSIGNGEVFALTLPATAPAPISLGIQEINNAVVLNWSNSVFILQSAPTLAGPFTNVPGATSPYTNAITGSQQFFQLQAAP